MIKFVYEIDGHKKYIFRYNTERSSASVTHPNSTTSEVDRIEGIQMFGDWVDSILGTLYFLLTRLAFFNTFLTKK